VSTFNPLNYFTTIDTGSDICGPAGDANCRGANSSEEFARQRTKIINTLSSLDADIIGLIELENNSTVSILSLVDGLNNLAGSTVWSFIDTGTIGTDAIRVGLLYKSTTVLPVGSHAILDSSVDPRFVDTSNRPVLLQTFEQRSNNERISVAIGHLKSKGSSCAGIGDPDLGDGQENCSVTRTTATQALADWLATDPTTSGDPDFLIFGDLNSNLQENPLTTLAAAGYVNVLGLHVGPGAYSFQYKGQSEALDHGLVSPSLLSQVTGAAEWHINTDEPRVFDYNLEFGRDPGLFDINSPFRVSDHDPIVIGFSLNSN
jgi:predicted extracellular nuclease